MRILIPTGEKMGSVWALSLLVSVSIFAIGCGEADKSTGSVSQASIAGRPLPAATTSTASLTPRSANGKLEGDEDDDDETPERPTAYSQSDNDADFDNDSKAMQNKGYLDRDDRTFIVWGRPADSGDEHAIGTLVKHYYELAAAGNGTGACNLIYVLFAEAIPEDYGQPPGPPALRGTTCAAVMTKLFSQEHQKLVADSASIRVTGVRIQGNQGRALVGFTTTPASYIQLHRERRAWRIIGTLAVPLP
jgi:hypothetical protein